MTTNESLPNLRIPGCSVRKKLNECLLIKDYVHKNWFWLNADLDKDSITYPTEAEAIEKMEKYEVIWKNNIN